MAGFPTYSVEQVIIDGIELCGVAWTVTDVSDLWVPAQLVGDDAEIPGGDTIPRRKTRPPKKAVLPMDILSDVDSSGTPRSDRTVALEENLDELLELVELLTDGDGTRDLVVVRASGAQWGNPCHVLGLTPGRVRPSGTRNAALTVSIPAGKLERITGS